MTLPGLQSSRSEGGSGEEYLPESDGKPMAETDIHRDLMLDLLDALAEHFRDQPSDIPAGDFSAKWNNRMPFYRITSRWA